MRVDFFNNLHSIFLRLKGGVLVVFILTFALVSMTSNFAFGQGPVSVVETPVKVLFDNQTKTYIATQNTVEGALKQGGITLAQNDVTEPARDSYLTGKAVEIKVVRALPVLISDGNQQQLAFSAFADPVDVFKQLNIEVFPEDKVSRELITDPVDEMAVGQKISITRAPTFTVYVDDSTQIVRGWGQTIGEVLRDKVKLAPRDMVEPSLEASSVNVDSITITRVNVAEIEETVVVPFTTTYKNDYNMYQGQTAVAQEGANGQKKNQLRVTYHNGAEVDRVVLSSEVLIPVQNKIVAKGVKPYSHQDLWNIMLGAQAKYGVDPSAMFSVMMCESGGNVYSGAGSSHQGLFQWDGSFYNWATKAGVSSNIFDPTAQIYATAARVSASGGWGAWSCKP